VGGIRLSHGQSPRTYWAHRRGTGTTCAAGFRSIRHPRPALLLPKPRQGRWSAGSGRGATT